MIFMGYVSFREGIGVGKRWKNMVKPFLERDGVESSNKVVDQSSS